MNDITKFVVTFQLIDFFMLLSHEVLTWRCFAHLIKGAFHLERDADTFCETCSAYLRSPAYISAIVGESISLGLIPLHTSTLHHSHSLRPLFSLTYVPSKLIDVKSEHPSDRLWSSDIKSKWLSSQLDGDMEWFSPQSRFATYARNDSHHGDVRLEFGKPVRI